MSEKQLQTEIIKYLKSKGCFVMKCSIMPGIPVGTADIFFCIDGFYGFIEAKKTAKSPFRPLQKEFLAKIDDWSWAKAVYPENWLEVRSELDGML